MIVNQIDEKNQNNNKTIDIDTDVYLTLLGADIGDSTYCFNVIDKDTSIRVDTTFDSKLDEEKKLYFVSYEINGIQISGVPRRIGYAKLIEGLLNVHGDLFRSSERRFGIIQQVTVDVTPQVIEKIAKWENGNGGR